MQEAYDDEFPVKHLISLTREVGRLPVAGDLKLKAHTNENFPSNTTFSKWSRDERVAKIADYCRNHEGHQDVLDMCPRVEAQSNAQGSQAESSEDTVGFVYLIKSGRYYYELSIQQPERVVLVHEIRTDDPAGIEVYWHRRFENRRKNGEWFELDARDIRAFRRRKFM